MKKVNGEPEIFCSQCLRILAVEEAISARTKALKERVEGLSAPIRQRNNVRWQQFSWWCQLPLIGRYILWYRREPKGLEEYPNYNKETWYQSEIKAIRECIQKLDGIKAKHLGHPEAELCVAAGI